LSGCTSRQENRMSALKLTQIGNSVGVILPKELLVRLKLEKGDTVFVTEAANGVTLTPYDPALDEQLQLGREFMREYRDTFHQLAK
jgi:putative addiction module antidote